MVRATVFTCATLLAVPLLLIALVLTVRPAPSTASGQPDGAPSSFARQDIPPEYLRWYMDAARTCPGLHWSALAGIGKVESDHGRSRLSGIRSGHNHAGAGGPMQFLAPTWAAYGADANGDGHKDRYDPADAIHGAAAYLCATGARGGDRSGLRKALFTYNHAHWYVDLVLRWAARYAASPVAVVGGVAAKVIAYARAQLGKPYGWGATGPHAYDCSGLAMMAYRAAGITIPRTTFAQWPYGVRIPKGHEQPGDLVFFNSGPGTATDRPGHVGIVIGGGRMINARCTACRPGIAIQPYDRPTLIGFTRPVARRN
ncbi:hypothetical protein DPM19_09500 [Actinomadura craniellae]|uniref:NlpC/P60 domain-containing protein n=1 Tax=Actinomadura craniellae TaxID=2231787 RepID=A0A365H7B8_9ACTN|nr:lytic transglycosylase domain-containing protein [Actinomadura craniellae]RAY14977.1 hypothetical protein DPM19_09500 [Actinomadura craniellae]